MKKQGRVRLELSTILMLLVSLFFLALGITLLINLIVDAVKTGKFAAVGLIMTLPCLGFGIGFFVMSIKAFIRYIKGKLALSYGEEGFCSIIGTKVVAINYRGNHWFALQLKYTVREEEKTFTTDYLFHPDEVTHLNKLKQISMIERKGFVVITESFSKDLYQTVMGIPKEYIKEKPYSTLINLMAFFSFLGLLVLVLEFIFQNRICLVIGIGLLAIPNIILGIIYAIKVFGKKK